MEHLRNYGDERILEFDRLANDWAGSTPDLNHPNNHLYHAERYRRKAKEFRAHHDQDKHWKDREEYPTIEVGKTYEARNHGVFTIAGILDYDHPARKNGYLYISTVGTYYTEGGRGTESYDEHWSDLVKEITLS